MLPDFQKAEILFNRSLWDTWTTWARIFDLRAVAKAGLPYASQVIAENNNTWAIRPEIQRLFPDQDSVKLWEERTNRCLHNAGYAIDAASLVFAHSILDAVVIDYCCVIACLVPDKVIDLLRKHGNMKNGRASKLTSEDAIRNAISHVSLPNKINGILTLCGLAPDWIPADWANIKVYGVYAYDSERLKHLDFLRHEVVHGIESVVDMGDMDLHLFFLSMTSTYLFEMIKHAFSVQVDPVHILMQPS